MLPDLKISSREEVLDYLKETASILNKIKEKANSKNKTTRIKAFYSIIAIVEGRIVATVQYMKNGGYELFPLVMQKSLYDPIIEYLIEELK